MKYLDNFFTVVKYIKKFHDWMLKVDECLCSFLIEMFQLCASLCVYSFEGLFVGILCICLFGLGLAHFSSAELSSPWAVVLQFRFQASFISHTGVTAFLIFQTNGHVSIAACQFWFYDSFIIECVKLQCIATDGLLHFSHGQGMSLLCMRKERTDVCLHMCMFASRHVWL